MLPENSKRGYPQKDNLAEYLSEKLSGDGNYFLSVAPSE